MTDGMRIFKMARGIHETRRGFLRLGEEAKDNKRIPKTGGGRERQ